MARINKKKYPFLFIHEDGLLSKELYDINKKMYEEYIMNGINLATRTGGSNPIYATRSFAEIANKNADKLDDCEIPNGCYNILFSNKHIFINVENRLCTLFLILDKYILCKLVFDQHTNDVLSQSYVSIFLKEERRQDALYICVLAKFILLFRHFATIETKKINPGTKVKIHNCKYKNETKYNLDLCDVNWFTTSVRDHPFFVRGHWRKQKVGENRSGTKLTWVSGHMKNGYVRKARKLNS